MKACIHFVGFRGDEYNSALRIWGEPDFTHMWWDRRANREIGPDDTVIFSQSASTDINQYNAPDPDGGLRQFEKEQA